MVATDHRYTVASVKRAVELINAFLQPPHQFALTELSNATGQTKNQTFRLLQTLADEGVVAMEPATKRYSLGYRVLEWGVTAQKGSRLTVVASPVLDQLSEDVQETIVLTARADDFEGICVDKRESAHALQISARVGRRVPLHAGAGSKCLLAYSPDAFFDRFVRERAPFEPFTEKTITDVDRLREEVNGIRERGVSISDEDLDLGACSIAAPIHDHTDQVIGAISIASPKTRFTDDIVQKHESAVKAAAAEISRQLMHHF